MSENAEYKEYREYINNLKLMKSEVIQILREGDEKKVSRAAQHYPGKLNHLLMKRNIKSARAIFPFADLALLQERSPDMILLDLNIPKDDLNLLREVIERIEQELMD